MLAFIIHFMNRSASPRDPNLIRTVIIIVSIALALLVTLICVVDVILVRRRMSSRTTPEMQAVQPATALPKSVPTMAPPTQPVVAVEVVPTAVPPTISPPPTTAWRFLRINAENIGTFENVANPDQKLQAKCIDPQRPPPNKGAIYILDGSGILKLESGGKKYQRFKITSGQ
jgi:hypothetical protein